MTEVGGSLRHSRSEGLTLSEITAAAPPQTINMGIGANWFPAREQLMATDGLKLITTTVTWKGVTQKHRLALAKAFTKPYIKVTEQGRAAVKGYP